MSNRCFVAPARTSDRVSTVNQEDPVHGTQETVTAVNSDPKWTAAVAALRSLTADGPLPQAGLPYSEVLQQARRHLGPFASLPDGLRRQLVHSYQDDEALRTLTDGWWSRRLIDCGGVVGRLFYGTERSIAKLMAPAPRTWHARIEALRRRLRRRARQSTHLPFRARRGLARVAARMRTRLGRPRLGTMLRAADFDLRRLGFDYLEELRQVPGCASVLRQSRTTCTQLIGLDFIASGGVLWFLEGNGNPALMDARLALYPEGQDPWVAGIIDAATRRGFRRVLVYGYRPFSPGHAAALEAGGRAGGVDVSIVDDIFSVQHDAHPRAWLIDSRHAGGAFVVRAKTFDVLFDRALLSKRQTRSIVASRADVLQAAGVGLAHWLAPGEEVPQYQPASPYPTLVAKIDGLDRGAGVSFYKLRRFSDELAAHADYCEMYHVPDPCRFRVVRGRREELPDIGARAWKIRSYALLTPEGVEYLSSIKVISGRPVPDTLAEGPVAEKNIYLATINEGGVYSAVTDEEDRTYQRASEAVGSVLLEWLSRKYGADALQPSPA